MKIELLGALDYEKLKIYLKDKVENINEVKEFINKLEKKRRTDIVAAAGRLSRFPGNVFEVFQATEEKDFEKNVNFIKRVTSMGHNSITDHDYCVFAIQDVTPIIEQTIIEERYSSFTIKSRREVDFSNAGFFTPNFRNKNYEIIPNNQEVQKEYQSYMSYLFNKYKSFVKNGIPIEDARFSLPYSYYSNIIMGVDAHTLKDMIIKYTKTKYSHIQELKEFGQKLYEIAKIHVPYIIEEIDLYKETPLDGVDIYLNNTIPKDNYQIINKTQLLNHSQNIDETILINAIMRRYQYDFKKAQRVYYNALKLYPDFKENLMKKIAFDSDKLELTQVNFQFQIPISFAVLTHLTRHRTHDIEVPDFVPNIDLTQYKIPPKLNGELKQKYINLFIENKKIYDHFKNDYGIIEEDLIYFVLSGNMVNIITNMNGKTLEHILHLRECNKTQWETRQIAYDMHKEIDSLEDAKIFSRILGATCTTQGICNEGKECCGKIYALQKQQNK